VECFRLGDKTLHVRLRQAKKKPAKEDEMVEVRFSNKGTVDARGKTADNLLKKFGGTA
jgi:hypothetical protein